MSTQHVCKLVVLGDSGVGKTTLIHSYVDKEFVADFKATIGADFSSSNLQIDNKEVEFQIWDTAGEERYHSVSSTFYRGTDACILVFDITNPNSFQRLSFWREQMIDKGGMDDPDSFPFVVFANKSDLEEMRQIARSEIEMYEAKFNTRVFEVSAKSGKNIEEGFEYIGREFLRSEEDGIQIHIGVQLKNDPKKPDRKCC